jgi:hypothetical protein
MDPFWRLRSCLGRPTGLNQPSSSSRDWTCCSWRRIIASLPRKNTTPAVLALEIADVLECLPDYLFIVSVDHAIGGHLLAPSRAVTSGGSVSGGEAHQVAVEVDVVDGLLGTGGVAGELVLVAGPVVVGDVAWCSAVHEEGELGRGSSSPSHGAAR